MCVGLLLTPSFSPTVAFVVVALLTGSASLFLIQALSSVENNEHFQSGIEFTTLAELFLGKQWHWAVQALLFVALQSVMITSLIESFQVSSNPLRIYRKGDKLSPVAPARAWTHCCCKSPTRHVHSPSRKVGYAVS